MGRIMERRRIYPIVLLAFLVLSHYSNKPLWAESPWNQQASDGDPATGVPLARESINYKLAGGPNLIEIDRATGEKIANYSIPTHQALTEAQFEELTKIKEEKRQAIDPTELRFRSGYIMHPQSGVEAEASLQMGRSDGYSYLVVQFGDVVKREVLDELEGTGIVFYDYVNYHAYYAKVPSGSFGRLESLLSDGEIRYIGTIPLEAKIEVSLLQEILANPGEAFEIAVQFFDTDAFSRQRVAGDFLDIYSQTARAVIGRAPGARILEIYQLDFVKWVEAWITPELHNLEGRMIHGADIISNLGDYTGSGVNVATMDTGIAQQDSTYHPDLPGSRIADQWDYQNNDAIANDDYGNSHGTHVAGSIGGEGNQEGEWMGMAPESNFHIYKLCCGTGQYSWFEDALQRASDHIVSAINNSWGGGSAGGYNSNSELADQAVRGEFGRYMNLVVSSGNDNTLTKSPGTAKNVITVGAVHDGNWPNEEVYLAGACWDYVWPPGERACFSNYGPIDADGNGHYRIKPDVMSTGPRTMSTAAWYTEGAYYRLLDGTSMSAPKIIGLIALFLDAYPGWVNWPEMVKARMIATAIDMDNYGYYGHGLVDAYHFIYDEPGVMENVLNVTSSVANNDDSKTYNFTVPSGFDEVRVVLTWADPPGVEEAINDLDLSVYDADGVHRGSSTYYDHVVEKVIAASGTAGTWQVVVDPYDLGQPSQYFALTAYVVMAPPSLSLNAWSSERWLKPGEYFYFFTELENSGGPAAGSYVWFNAPNGTIFQVQGGRLYPEDDTGYTRSHYYYEDEIHAHTEASYNEYSMATGEVTGANTPLVRWYVRIDPGTTWNGDAYFYSRGYAQNGLSTTQQTVSVGVDDTPPSNPTSFYSTSHSVGVWSNDRTVDLIWSGATDNVSGVYGYSLANSTSPSTIPDAIVDTTGTSFTTGSLGDSANWYFHIRTRDNAENWNSGAVHQGPYKIDGTAPTGSILINGGAAETISLIVTLNLSATDPTSGVAHMRFSNNGSTWSSWEPYSTTKNNWDLSAYGGNSTPGIKVAYAQFRDAANNVSATYSDTIMYSPAPPCEGDLNGDGQVDMQDWFLFGQDWGRTDCNDPGADPCEGDLNSDGQVDMQDWFLFGQDWGRTDCPIP